MPYRLDVDLLSKEFHRERRQTLREQMPDNSVAVLFSNPIRNRSGDVDYDYHQDPNFYYLSGHTEGNSMLLIFKEPQTILQQQCNEILFLEERNASQEMWTGRILGTSNAPELLGIQTVFKNTEFENLPLSFDGFSRILAGSLFVLEPEEKGSGSLYTLQEHYLSLIGTKNKEKQDFKTLGKLLMNMRAVKQAEELVLMRKAIAITCDAHLELIKSIEPDMAEYQAQSIVEYVFKSKGAESVAYPSIVGSGENSCVLHPSRNRKKFVKNDLLLTDAGAEYHGYAADITRTVPVNGKFTEEQKAIYELVLAAQEAAILVCKAGNNFYATHREAVKVIQAGLLQLGIIKDASDYRNYFAHGTSHFLGLDVHDVGTKGDLKVGNILTVEPGIYIPEGSDCDKKWWNIGVRIEDDILITNAEPENLSARLPKTIVEIEALMILKGAFEK